MKISLTAQHFAPADSGPGVDSAWEQYKLEARKMFENAADVHPLQSIK